MSKKTSWRKDAIAIIAFIIIGVGIILSFNQILCLALNTNSPLVVVTSESMEPTYYGSRRLENGGEYGDIRKDMLIVKGVEHSIIKVGDVIVFNYINHTEENIPIVHRVTRVYQDNETGDYWFSTKGDNPNSNNGFVIETPSGRVDELNIHESRVVGKIVGRIPYIGGIFYYFQGETGRYILIVGAVIIFLMVTTFSLLKRKEEKDAGEIVDKEKKLSEFFKRAFKKLRKQKHFAIPGFVLFIIILVPIIDTLDANWGSNYGIVDLNYRLAYADNYLLPGEVNATSIITYVTINNPGHWHQEFRRLNLQIKDNASLIIGEGVWTAIYNFEGQKTISICVWVPFSSMLEGSEYTITAIAHLSTKFGRVWTDSLTETFIF